jgi:excisionase family DNA binding protein
MSYPIRPTLTRKELAWYLKIGVETLDRLRSEGLIRSYRIRTQIRFVLEEVMEDLRRHPEEFPLRKLMALQKSGGPRRPERDIRHTKEHTIVLEESEEKESVIKDEQ